MSMMLKKGFRFASVLTSVLGMLFGSQFALAAGPAQDGSTPAGPAVPPRVAVADVELGAGGLLVGRVVDARGLPVAGVPVAVEQDGHVVATLKSEDNGDFRVKGLRGGVHRVVVRDGATVLRLWAAKTAPPTARQSLMVVSDKDILAAQHAPLKVWLADPFVMAGIVAVAVAVPVAVAASRDSGS